MLKDIMQSAIQQLSNGNVVVNDIYSVDFTDTGDKKISRNRITGVWKFRKNQDDIKFIIADKHPLYKIAETNGCQAINILWGKSDVTIKTKHQMLKTKKDIINCLKSIDDSNEFALLSEGRYIHDERWLNFDVEKIWLRFRGDFTSMEKPMFAMNGSLEMHPWEKGFYFVAVWSLDNSMSSDFIYKQYIPLRDILIMDEAEAVAMLL